MESFNIIYWILDTCQLLSQPDLQSLNLSQSNFILLLYLLTFKRSHIYCAAFVVLEVVGFTGVFGVYNSIFSGENKNFEVMQHATYAIVYLIFVLDPLMQTDRKSLKFICSTIIGLDLAMAIGYLAGGDAALYLYNNYESLVLCLHVLLILSLYKPAAIIDHMAAKFRDFCRSIDHILFFNFFWYTKTNTMRALQK